MTQLHPSIQSFGSVLPDNSANSHHLACIFDALHDMGDPVGAARHIRETLKPNGTFMLVEPLAGDSMQENMNPIGQIFYGFRRPSARLRRSPRKSGWASAPRPAKSALPVLNEAGFGHVRRAAETETNMVLEVKA